MSTHFAEMVRAYRQQLGMTQEELAEAAGLSVRSIGKIEAGQTGAPRPTTSRVLANAFGLTGAERERFCRTATGIPSTVDVPVPAQLPADVAGFTGRAAYLDQLDAALPSEDAALASEDAALPGGSGRPAAVVVSAIGGSAGIGKTALAVHWAHRVADRFPDGQLYVNLRGFDPVRPPVDPANAVLGFLDALGVPPERIPSRVEAQYGLYRSLLAGRRMLVLLDNARDAEQVRPLLPGSPGCAVLVTSRSSLAGLIAAEGARSVVLGLLTPAEARELLAARLGRDRVDAEPQAVDEIIVRCGGLPLGLVIVAAQAMLHPGFPLAALAEQLGGGEGRSEGRGEVRLDGFAGEDPVTDLRAVFSWSYRTLSPAGARLFRLLALHPGPCLGALCLGSLAGVPESSVRRLLGELSAAHLITEQKPGRYTFHDLLRAYAKELTQSSDAEAERRAAVGRMIDHYLHTAHRAAAILNPHRNDIVLPPPDSGATVVELDSAEAALAWFSAEYPQLRGAVEEADRYGFDTQTWQLAWALAPFLEMRGPLPDLLTVGVVGLRAAQRTGDPLSMAHAHRVLGHANFRLGRLATARDHTTESLRQFEKADEARGQTDNHVVLGLISEQEGDPGTALDHARRALDLFRLAGDKAGQAHALNGIGWLYSLLGDHHEALAYCQRALALYQEIGGRHGEAQVLHSIGYVYHQIGNHPQAVAFYRRSLALLRDLGDRQTEATALTDLGDAHHAAGDPAAARDAWQQAVRILTDLDHPDAETVQAKLDALVGIA